MLDPDFHPQLRHGLRADPSDTPDFVYLHDGRGLVPGGLTVSRATVSLLEQFDGTRTVRKLREMQAPDVPPDHFSALVSALDAALLLDSPAFHAYLTGPERRPSCLGCYPDDPADIRTQLGRLFTDPGGPGVPTTRPTPSEHGRLRAVLVPHMDYARGGVTYGWGFRELAEQTDARLFVIVATSHYSLHRFTLTRMNFRTPLGVVETDQAYVNRISAAYGPEAFADPYAHLPEHSVELEVLLLQYLFETRGPVRIVPLVVGSFGDRVDANASPAGAADIGRMVDALRSAEAAAGEPVCYVISGDLAHIGPKFGDPARVDDTALSQCRGQDEKLLGRLGAVDVAGYFDVIAAEADARRICGLPPTWVALSAARPKTGRVLRYDRYVHPRGHESVSFAAAAFYG
ncbi:MAG: AmmeMemoRadiSam system protein B [Fimbriiglobus sp.]